jgi:RNA polymerase sigma factor (sigma-70 family)
MAIKNINDIQSLWGSFLSGDDKAFAGIYHAFAHDLLSYGKKLSADSNLVNDALQEIFLDLYLKRNKTHVPISSPKAYLFTALKNTILKKQIQNRKYTNKEIDFSVMSEFNIEYSFQDQLINAEISKEKSARLQQAIVTLSPGQKEIIYLKFEQELEYSEIAQLMNITIESARKQLYRALVSLREVIDNELFLTLFYFFRKKI